MDPDPDRRTRPASGFTRRFRALLIPALGFLALAALAWSGRWEPVLEFSLRQAVFYLETPPILPEGATPEPPVVNCAAQVQVRNAGTRAVETTGHLAPTPGEAPRLLARVEWNPPQPRDDGSSCWISRDTVILLPGEHALASAFTHLDSFAAGALDHGPGRDRLRFRVVVDAYRPATWRVRLSEWAVRHVNLGSQGNDWLLGLLDRRPQVVSSPWFEAVIPDPATLTPDAGAQGSIVKKD